MKLSSRITVPPKSFEKKGRGKYLLGVSGEALCRIENEAKDLPLAKEGERVVAQRFRDLTGDTPDKSGKGVIRLKLGKAPEKIKNAGRPVKVLNLFAYTGGATIAAAAAGTQVTHVDAAKGMVAWAKENAASSGLGSCPIRYFVDDCVKLVERELRRGNRYDGILMDPPSYGRGPKGELWKLEEKVFELITLSSELLSDDAAFFLINSRSYSGVSHFVQSSSSGASRIVSKHHFR